MTLKWYEKPLRCGALQCNYENGRNFEVPDMWKSMGVNVEYLKHLFDTKSTVGGFDPDRHGDILVKYIKLSHEKGVRIVIYLNIHILLTPEEIAKKEEWSQRKRDGSLALNYETHVSTCVNSGWRNYFFKRLERVAGYDIDGIILDGPGVTPGGCFCAACKRIFREKYGKDLLDASPAEVARFGWESIDGYMRETYRRFKALKPEAYIHNNLPHANFKMSNCTRLPQALDYNDVVVTEGGFKFYSPAKLAETWWTCVVSKLLEAIAPGKPHMSAMAADHRAWSWYPHSAVETRLCLASMVAHGSSTWYGFHGSREMAKGPGPQAAAEFMRFLARNEEYYTATRSLADVAVMYSLDTEAVYKTSTVASDFYGQAREARDFGGNFRGALNGIYDMLSRTGIPYDLVTDIALTPAKLARYACVIVPTGACLSDESLAALRAYVKRGGNLISTFDISIYQPSGERRPDLALADVLGVNATGAMTDYKTWNYFTVATPHAIFDGVVSRWLPAPAKGLDVAARKGAEVLARFLECMAGCYVNLTEPDKPAIILNRFGKGKSLYFAGTFGEMADKFVPPEYRLIFTNAVRAFAPHSLRLEGDVMNVDVGLRGQKGRTLIHLLNYAGHPPRPFEKIYTQRNFQVVMPGFKRKVKKVFGLVSGKRCAWKQKDGALRIKVSELKEYEVIVVE